MNKPYRIYRNGKPETEHDSEENARLVIGILRRTAKPGDVLEIYVFHGKKKGALLP